MRADAQSPTDAGASPEALRQRQELAACAASDRPAPSQIGDVIARINELPQPASIACLVASLPRPLSLVASLSSVSEQPADGLDSPRIFILFEKLTLSVVATGDGRDLLEFGEWVTPVRSVKGELHFPVSRPLSDDAPYQGLVDEGQRVSTCGFCHANEEPHPTRDGAFVSDALRVALYAELELAELRRVRAACDQPGGERPACLLLRALFDYGEVRPGLFDRAVTPGF